MTQEQVKELMNTRYEVIADYPGNPYYVGFVLQFSSAENKAFEQYPHLFKLLKWWERRDLVELPAYLKTIGGKDIGKVERHYYHQGYCQVWFPSIGGVENYKCYYDNYLPATPEEYNAFLTQQ